jgi:hypothetical protein
MAGMKGLVLALYPTEEGYDDFYVGDVRVSLVKVTTPTKFTLHVEMPGMNYRYEVTDRHATEIMPEVKVAAGRATDASRSVVRIVVDAPRHIRVLRGKLYREGHEPRTD